MVASVTKLPKLIPMQVWRPPEANIPPTNEQRNFIKRIATKMVAERKLVPPMPMDELREYALELLAEHRISADFLDFTAVILNNMAWEDQLAAVPYERRLLLMSKCMRKEEVCTAPFDEFGLLCKDCGQCSLQDLQDEAERLGYAVLIAEGSTLVMAMIETGKIEAVVGVSCLNVMERAFPFMEAAAIPGVAIPLLQSDCVNTNVDLDWLWDVIHLTSDDKTRRLDLDALRDDVKTWFAPETLEQLMGPSKDLTEQIARGWLAKDGKRWRPFLAACVYKALSGNLDGEVPDGLKKAAIAVECFHKASLVHDDIEDDDALRYGEETLHETHGIPVALNAGDLLIGEGYRLLAESGAPPHVIAEMVKIAADGQRTLCLGQGAELNWLNAPKPLNPTAVLDIFAKKTAPAFDVALRVGAAFAGADEDIHNVLRAYSLAMGIAYQIRDDLDDADNGEDPNDIEAMRPSVLMAVAHQKAAGDTKKALANLWRRQKPEGDMREIVKGYYDELEVIQRVKNLQESYKEEAVLALKVLGNSNLKGLLRRVIGKIFNENEMTEWCGEYERRNAEHQAAKEPISV